MFTKPTIDFLWSSNCFVIDFYMNQTCFLWNWCNKMHVLIAVFGVFWYYKRLRKEETCRLTSYMKMNKGSSKEVHQHIWLVKLLVSGENQWHWHYLWILPMLRELPELSMDKCSWPLIQQFTKAKHSIWHACKFFTRSKNWSISVF